MERSVLHWVCVFSLGAVSLLGCTDVVEFGTYRFEISESLPDLSVAPSQGVKICEEDTDTCDTTDPLGRANLEVLPNQEVTFTVEKEGYGSYIMGDVVKAGGSVTLRMYPNEQLAAIAQQLGTPYPWEEGMVALSLFGSPQGFPGVTFTPVDSTIGAVGEPFYFDAATRQYSPDLEATTAIVDAHVLPLLEGGFAEVTPGEQQFEFGGTAVDCIRPARAWPGDTPNRIRVPVREGYATRGSIVCDGP